MNRSKKSEDIQNDKKSSTHNHQICRHCHQNYKGINNESQREIEKIKTIDQQIYFNNPEQQSKSKQQDIHSKSGMTKAERKKMEQIIKANFKYFSEKTKVCCEVKPPKQKLSIPGKTGNTLYKTSYTKKPLDLEKPFKPSDINYKADLPFDPHSTYKQNYVNYENTPKSQKIKHIPKDNLNEKDAPRFLQTQYKDQFKAWKPQQMMKLPMKDSNIFKTGKFQGKSIYQSNYIGSPSKIQVVKQNPNYKSSSIFKGPNVEMLTQYNNYFSPKPLQKKQKTLKKYGSTPSLKLPGQYTTQYKNSYVPKQSNNDTCNYKAKTMQQMVDLIMNL